MMRHPGRPVSSWKYRAVHRRLNKWFPRSGECELCGSEGKTHYARKDHTGLTDSREDYLELCVTCHRRMDNGILDLTDSERREKRKEGKLRRGRERRAKARGMIK